MPTDGSVHTAEGSSRKRLKISRDDSRPAGMLQTPDIKPLASPMRPRTQAHVSNDLHADGTPCHHEQSLRGMHDNLDSMRQLITCKICQRFLYEPYALPCGHTYCYSCLCQWLGQNRKKTCPDCRTIIKEIPFPSYLVREMVLVFTSKSELLPDGETSEEHKQYAKEEADIVATDKANPDPRAGGLFRGCFNRPMPLIAIRDASDNVDRCPQCLHEVEDGRCNMCDVRVRQQDDDLDWSDEDSDESEELDQDLDAEDHDFPLALDNPYDYMYDPDHFDDDLDDFDYGYDIPQGLAPRNGPVSDVSGDESEDHDPSMDGFIDDGTIHLYDESSDVNGDSDGTEVEQVQSHRRRRAAPIVISDEEEDEDEDVQPAPPRRRRVLVVRTSSSRGSEEPSSAGAEPSVVSEDEDDDEGPVTASQRSRAVRRVARYVDEEDEEDSGNESESINASAYGGFSPLQGGATGDSDEGDHEEEHDYRDHYDDYNSIASGPTELSVEHYDDDDDDDEDDRESDGSNDGWGIPNSPNAMSPDHRLTHAADTPADTRAQSHASSHRLNTLGSRRNRHADPDLFSESPPSYSSLFPNIPTSQFSRRLQPQQPPRRNLTNPAFQPVRPSHPFQLSNTLAHLNDNSTPNPRYTATRTRRNDSNVSSQSSVGGVSVGSAASASGSSGSSATVRADVASQEGTADRGSRRRRHAEIEDEESDY